LLRFFLDRACLSLAGGKEKAEFRMAPTRVRMTLTIR